MIKVGRQAGRSTAMEHTNYTHGTAEKNETPLFLFRAKLGNLENLEKEAFLALR